MDGELVERLAATGRAVLDPHWPCFYTRLYRWTIEGAEFGVVGGTIGAPFAVLVADLVQWVVADVTKKPELPLTDLWHDRAVLQFLTEAEDQVAYRDLVGDE